jgi:putative membrane protein
MRIQTDEAAIAAAVKAAEAKTSGQVVCVLARQSGDSTGPAALYAAIVALLIPWPLLAATQWPANLIFAIQLGVFLAGLLLLGLTPFGVALLPRRERRRQAFRLAAEQFYLRGLSRTRHRAGVLIFVSLAERYAQILADEGLDHKISEAEWRAAVAELVAHLRAGRITEGFVGAVQTTGDLLARAAPPDGESDNELPDGLVKLD